MKSQFQLGNKKEAEESGKESNKLEMNTQLAVEVEVEVELSSKLELKKKRLVKISSFFLFPVAWATKKREERKEVNETRGKKKNWESKKQV